MDYLIFLFLPNIRGDDLKEALLEMFNNMKHEQIYTDIFELCDISMIFKKKASRNEFKNYRGIFGTSIFRYTLDKLIYNDMYDVIDQNLSDSNVGCHFISIYFHRLYSIE